MHCTFSLDTQLIFDKYMEGGLLDEYDDDHYYYDEGDDDNDGNGGEDGDDKSDEQEHSLRALCCK